MYKIEMLIEWAKQGLARRDMFVKDEYWDFHKTYLGVILNKRQEVGFEYLEAEDILNLLLAAAFQFIKYNQVYDVDYVYHKRLKCPPGRFVSTYEKNFCGSVE